MRHKTLNAFFISILLFSLFSLNAQDIFITKKTIQKIKAKYGEKASKRAVALQKLMLLTKNGSERDKLLKINRFFNQMRYITDRKLWKQKDYWATRVEFLGKGAGDCEDYVISKYFTLKQLGISTKKLYFTYVKAIKYKEAHMVLTYFKTPRSIPLVLDSINPKILPATSRKDLVPVYSFNGDALFLAKQTGLGQIVPSGNRKNKKWLRLVDKIKKEGL